MATQVFKDAKVWLAQFALTSYLSELEIQHEADALDKTVFGNTTRQFQSGLEKFSFGLKGFADYADEALDEIVRTRVGTQDVPITFGLETGLVNTRAILIEGGLGDYQQGGSVGVLVPFNLPGFASKGRPIVPGTILEDATVAKTANGNGTAYQLGAVGAAQKLYASLHVLTYSGFTNVVVKVQSDTSGFPSPTDRVTFATVTGLTSEFATPVDGAITDDWHRISWTVTGVGSITFIVAMGIK